MAENRFEESGAADILEKVYSMTVGRVVRGINWNTLSHMLLVSRRNVDCYHNFLSTVGVQLATSDTGNLVYYNYITSLRTYIHVPGPGIASV